MPTTALNISRKKIILNPLRRSDHYEKKTRTAENSQGRDHGWFVGYGPFENPTIVVSVIVEQGGYGASSAVPIGRKIMEAAFAIANDRAQYLAQKNNPQPAPPQ